MLANVPYFPHDQLHVVNKEPTFMQGMLSTDELGTICVVIFLALFIQI